MKIWKILLTAMVAVMMICSIAMAAPGDDHEWGYKDGDGTNHTKYCITCKEHGWTRWHQDAVEGCKCDKVDDLSSKEEPTCGKAGTETIAWQCEDCKAIAYEVKTYGEPTGFHKYDVKGDCECGAHQCVWTLSEEVVEEEATCEEPGLKTIVWKCVNEKCGELEKETKEIPTAGKHDFYEAAKVEPNCKYEGNIVWKCTDCGAEETEILKKDAENHAKIVVENVGDADVHVLHCEACQTKEVGKEAHDFTKGDCVCGAAAPKHVCTKKVYESTGKGYHNVICPECGEVVKGIECEYANNVCVFCGQINPETPVEDAITCENGHVGAKVYEKTDLGYHNVICSACNETVEKGLTCEYTDGKCPDCGAYEPEEHKCTEKTYEWTGKGYHNVICPDCGYTVKGIECEYAEGKCIYCGDAHKHTAKVYEWTGHGYHNVICPDCGEIFKGLECEYVVVYNTEEATCETDGKNWKYRECIYCGDQKDYAEEILPATGHEWVNNKCTVCGKKLTKIYYNNTMSSFGPMTKELVGGNDWYRVTPVDLSVDGVYTYDLIASNRYVVGTVTITVAEGALTVNYKVASSHVEVKDESLLIYASKADLAEGNAVTANVGAAINVAETFGEDTKVIVSLVLIGNYDALGHNVTTMVADAAEIAGMIANID